MKSPPSQMPDIRKRYTRIFALRAAALDGRKPQGMLHDSTTGSQVGGMDFNAWYRANRSVEICGRPVRNWVADYLDHIGLRNTSFKPPDIETSHELRRAVAISTWKRQLVGTVSGRPILAPETARRGDLVCVLYDCPVPVVFRKEVDHHVLVGECYVDDMMGRLCDGEQEIEGLPQTEFNIR
ncbi:hypothetical protein LTR85_004731 [Meristemomyces frigidus]|nr:hypothetical protein LTR85_004731 [Meristemomyces frigidus]